jgi:hypothetical protein
MAYIINKFNGEQLLVLEDGTLNNDLSVGLLGKNTIGYGEVQNENFVHLLENFAGNAPPSGQTLRGQVYFNTQTNQLNVYDGARWNIVGNATSSDFAPVTNTNGSLWLNTKTNQLFVYQDGEWIFVGPEGVDGFGETRAAATVVKDNQDLNRPIIKLLVNGQAVAVCSSSTFTVSSSENLTGFTVIRGGITLSSSFDVRGSLDGNAASATKLLSSRKINGVDFDGTADITISAASGQLLKAGEFIVGDEFNAEIIEGSKDGYVLVYYKDNSDRFSSPAQAIGVNSVSGNLPYENDANKDEYNYCDLDGYTNCFGAKLWYVPILAVDGSGNVDWSQASNFLFETNLIQYNEDGEIILYPNIELVITPIYKVSNTASGEYTITTTIA